VASEKVSFTRVIEATPPLRWLDMLGRRPAPFAASVVASSAPADPVSVGTAFSDPAAGPTVLSRTERLAWWVRRRRPGRHRRTRALL
jgi:hypothetical protein